LLVIAGGPGSPVGAIMRAAADERMLIEPTLAHRQQLLPHAAVDSPVTARRF
jgi:hypothetical protein